MFAIRYTNAFHASVAAVTLAALTALGSGCSKDEKLEQLWEGPAKLNTVGELPKAQPASATSSQTPLLIQEGSSRLRGGGDPKSRRGRYWSGFPGRDLAPAAEGRRERRSS